jgi:hypothetical protein
MTDAVCTSHTLKVWREPFIALWLGRKCFELRRDDRGFHLGDTLELVEWDSHANAETGRAIIALVEYIVRSDDPVPWAGCLQPDHVCMSIREIGRRED